MASPSAFRAQYLAAKRENERRSKPKAKPKARKAPEPGLKDYATSGLSALYAAANPQQTGMALGLQLGQALPSIYGNVSDYLTGNSPADVLGDVWGGAKATVRSMAANPLSTIADFVPGVGEVKGLGEDIQRAAELRAAGNPAAALTVERMALPFAVASLLPGVGEARGAGKMAVRAADDVLPDFSQGFGTFKSGPTKIIWENNQDGSVELISLRTPSAKRGKGAARAAMNDFLSAADAQGLDVSLGASPLDKRTKLNRLVGFYKSLGFEPTGRSINAAGEPAMVRRAAAPEAAAPTTFAVPRTAEDALPDLAVRDIGLGQKMYTTPEGSRITVMEDAKFAPRKNSITDFVVPEELRGQGRGGALLDAALQKYDPTEVSAAASSPSSAALLYKRGFRPAGEPNADLARALEIMKEDSSVTMVVPREPQGIIAYHGSPHSFDRFDISKIGTGEGAQAYGRGLYFAGNEDVARQYRDDLQRYEPSIEGVVVNHPTLLDAANYSFSVDDYVESLQRQLDRARQTYASTEDIERELADVDVRRAERKLADLAPYTGKSFARTPTGSMYQVRLNVRPEDLLDWDASFTPEGLESFAAKFDAVNPATRRMLEDWSYTNQQRGLPMPEGADVMRQLSGSRISSPELSQMLREAGVPGVQYLDQGSRSAGDGTRNYVMFGDDMIDLLRKYAVGGRVTAHPFSAKG